MKEKQINSFLEELFKKKITIKSQNIGSYTRPIIEETGQLVIEQMFRKFLSDNTNEKLAVLEAKVFTYQEIISKSTFAPMLDKKALAKEKKDTPEPLEETKP